MLNNPQVPKAPHLGGWAVEPMKKIFPQMQRNSFLLVFISVRIQETNNKEL